MYWMTIRQHRAQLLVTFGLLVAFGAVLLVHGIGNLSAADGLSGDELDAVLEPRHETLSTLIGWFPLVPVLIGLFWGAPTLAREFERGTHLLAWTQSVSRRQWVLTKLGLLGSLAALAGLAFGTMIDAWVETFDGSRFETRFTAGVFMSSGVAAAGWWLFAFALGATSGVLFRRMLPAMALTIVVFVVALWGFFEAREHYATPERVVTSATEAAAKPAEDTLPIGAEWIDAGGAVVSGQQCSQAPRYTACMVDAGYRRVIYQHGPQKYWRFQWTEAGLLFAAALALGGVGYHRGTRVSVR